MVFHEKLRFSYSNSSVTTCSISRNKVSIESTTNEVENTSESHFLSTFYQNACGAETPKNVPELEKLSFCELTFPRNYRFDSYHQDLCRKI